MTNETGISERSSSPQNRKPDTDALLDEGVSGTGKRFSLPVGVALGLVFSAMMIVLCGIIISYMAVSDRRIAGRLLDEGAAATLNVNKAVIESFFAQQDVAVSAVSLAIANGAPRTVDGLPDKFGSLFPRGTDLFVRKGSDTGATSDAERVQRGFVRLPGQPGPSFQVVHGLASGEDLVIRYPLSVFEDLLGKMKWEGRQRPFLLEGRDKLILLAGDTPVAPPTGSGTVLPSLSELGDNPLRALWTENAASHDMSGAVKGRLFPFGERMYTVIYEDVQTGPAAGWVLGTLYDAKDFGAALDQTRVVLYSALVALVVGALLSFVLGRLLGRPLTRLAEASRRIRELDFENIDPLPASRLTELNNVNSAFNGTVGALSAFARYVPKLLVKRLIEEGMTDPRRVEMRDMTIVFTDLAGFTSMASRLSAEETAKFLNRYFELVSDAVTRENGTIDKYIGDGVMAFWGAPSDQPDHKRLAVAAVRSIAKSLNENASADFRLRIGVHTGRVVVGNIGSESRTNYTVIGDAVNVAARLQEFGKTVDPGAKVIALVSEETMSGAGPDVEAIDVGRIALRGRSHETTVFRVA